MATQFTEYLSTDASAPAVTGTVADMVNLADKCLVTGYGSKPPAGWSKPYTGGSGQKAVFQQGSGSNGLFFRIQDDAPATAKEARVTGYATMSGIDTGADPFPSAAQGVGGVAMVVWRKSNTADSTARAWKMYADSRTAYLFIATGDNAGTYLAVKFGEFFSHVSADAFRVMIQGRTAENTALLSAERGGALSTSIITTTPGHFLARGHAGTGGSATMAVVGDSGKGPANNSMSGLAPYTNPSNGAIEIARVRVSDTQNTPLYGSRGYLRGFWHFLHAASGTVADGDTFAGVGDLAGRTFVCIKNVSDQSGNAGVAVIETSATVEAN